MRYCITGVFQTFLIFLPISTRIILLIRNLDESSDQSKSFSLETYNIFLIAEFHNSYLFIVTVKFLDLSLDLFKDEVIVFFILIMLLIDVSILLFVEFGSMRSVRIFTGERADFLLCRVWVFFRNRIHFPFG